MALGTFVPGHYAMTYDSIAVGIVEADNYALRYRFRENPIENTSPYGDTKIDGIYRGFNASLIVTFKEWLTPVKKAIWPWATGGMDGALGIMGRLGSSVAKEIVLTPQAGSPAAAAGNTFTFSLAKLAPENDLSILFGPVNRDIPVLFELLPFDYSGSLYLFRIT